MYSAHAKHRVTTALAGLADRRFGAAGRHLRLRLGGPAAGRPGSSTGTSGGTSANGTTGGTAAPAAAEPKGRVVSQLPLSIRSRATTQSDYLGSFPSGAVISLHCKVIGQNVDGNNRWYLLGNGRPGYVAARYVQNLSTVPWCQS